MFQMPADVSVLDDPAMREAFEIYWSVPGQSAKGRMKLHQAGVGPAWLRLCRASPAVREVLRRAELRDEQLQLPRGAMERLDRCG